MLKRLLAVFIVLLVADIAAAQPNLSYSCSRDSQGKIVTCSGLRPVVTGEMGIPPGTPFFDTSTFSLYYWSGSAWTGTNSSGSTFTGPILISDGTATAPALAFSTNTNTGLFYTATGALSFASGGAPIWWTAASNFYLRNNAVFGWLPAATLTAADLTLSREAAATLQMGGDSASAVSQTFKGADSTGNGTAGGILTIRAGAGTAGDAKGGNLNLVGGDNFGAGEEGVVVIVDGGTKPTCSAANRGAFWYDQGGAGVADTFEICAKSAADAYAWRSTSVLIP